MIHDPTDPLSGLKRFVAISCSHFTIEMVEKMHLPSLYLKVRLNSYCELLKFYENGQMHLQVMSYQILAHRAQSQQRERAQKQNREPRACRLSLQPGRIHGYPSRVRVSRRGAGKRH